MSVNKLLAALALSFGLVGLTASGQDAKKSDAPKDEKKTEPAKDTKKAEAPKAAKKVITAIVGGDIHTVTKGIIRGGTILIQDGKISKVGQDVAIPEGANKIDATGKVISPGFIAVSATNLGIRGGGGGGPTGGPTGGQSRLTDSLNPFDRNMQVCLGVGITTACVETGSAGGGRFGRIEEDTPDDMQVDDWIEVDDNDGTRVCPCCGIAILPTEPIGPTPPTERTSRRSAVLKLAFGDVSNMVVKETPFYHITAGSFAGGLNKHQWRETIKRAKQQVKDQSSSTSTEDAASGAPGMGGRRVSEEIIKLVEKKIPLRTEAYSAEQMREAIALAKELDYNLILDGVHEAWLMPGELSAAKVQVVITPRSRRRANPGKEDNSGSSIENSGALEKAGVPFTVVALSPAVSLDGIPGRDLTSLSLEAMFAVRGGASEQAALEAITINAARMLGLGDRLGSIEEGKDADLLILDGVPLDYRTNVQQAFVNGKLTYDRKREAIFPERVK